jgi:GxxExxY protein
MEHAELSEKIIGCAMTVHRTLGPGFLESVYQNALAHELRKQGLAVECEKKIKVHYDGIVVGDFSADMLVENTILIENKAVQTLAIAHEVQLVNYLTATGIEIGLLLNFGSSRLEFKRKTRTYHAKNLSSQESQGAIEEVANPMSPQPIL